MEGCCLRWRRELIHCASRGREYPYPYSATVSSRVRRTVSFGEHPFASTSPWSVVLADRPGAAVRSPSVGLDGASVSQC